MANQIKAGVAFHWGGVLYAADDVIDTTSWTERAVRELLSHAPVYVVNPAASLTKAAVIATGIDASDINGVTPTGLTSTLATKADTSALATKADASAVASALAAKADSSAVSSALAAKADASAVSSALAAKADASALAAKADASDLTAKQDKVARTTVSKTTASLADQAVSQTTVTLTKSYRLIQLTVDRACRVRVYGSAAEQAADVARAVGTDPSSGAGVLLDYAAAAAGTFDLSPQVSGSNTDTPVTTSIPVTITNLSGAAHTVTASFTYLPQES